VGSGFLHPSVFGDDPLDAAELEREAWESEDSECGGSRDFGMTPARCDGIGQEARGLRLRFAVAKCNPRSAR
jgi:hypothetical protein